MKVYHLPATVEADVLPVVEKALPMLDAEVAIVASVQHLSAIDPVKEFLESKGKKVTSYGQILGCSVPKMKENCILCIGTGQFHPKGILLKGGKKVIVCDTLTQEATEFTEKDIDKILKRKKGALMKFYDSQTIGVMITTKPGQSTVQGSTDKIIKLKDKFPDKNFYYFATGNLDFHEMENFPFVDVWVNTMCPRIGNDDAMEWVKPILNIGDLDER